MDDLNALEGQVLAHDADQAQAEIAALPPDQQPKPEPSRDEQALDMVNGFADFAGSYAPEVMAVWTPEVRQRGAAVVAPLLEKYNISMVNLPIEVLALFVLAPPLYRTSVIIAAKIKADRAAQTEAPAKTDGAKTEGPAMAVHDQVKLYQ